MLQTPSARLSSLAALIRAPLLNEPVPAVAIDAELAAFAIARHRVGPLLHVAAQAASGPVDAKAREMLAQHFRERAFEQAKTDIALKEIGARFFAGRIPWLAFKGLPLARQLYPNPSWRSSHDIDILVPPHAFKLAREALAGDGFVVASTRLPPEHWIERAIERLAKDAALKQTRSGLLVELHRRLFFAGPVEAQVPLLRDAFKPRVGADAKDIPAPVLGAGLALYLALHGATARWFRLKWLIDLVPLMSKLDDTQKSAMIDAAESMKSTTAVKAAFLLLDRVFGGLPLGPIAAWMREPDGHELAEARAASYLAALDNWGAVDPKGGNGRFDALDLHFSMKSGWRYRGAVLLRGSAWITLDNLRRRWPLQTGTAFQK